MERLLGRITSPVIGWIGASLGVIWKGTEIVHNAAYLKSIMLEHFDGKAIAGFLFGHPSLALVLAASAWIVYSKRHEANSAKSVPPEIASSPAVTKATFPERMPRLSSGPPSPEVPDAVGFDEVIVRERIVEREIVYRKRAASPCSSR